MRSPACLLRSSVLATIAVVMLGAMVVACSDDAPEDTPTATVSYASTPRVPETRTPLAASADLSVTEDSTPAPSATPGLTTTPAPVTSDYAGFLVVDGFAAEAPIDFPEDLMLVIATGCTQCDSPPEALYRVWRNHDEPHVDLLFDASKSGIEGATVLSFAVSPQLNDLVATVCIGCTQGPLVSASSAVFRSLDGGATWREVWRTEQGQPVYARAVTVNGVVLERLDGSLFYLRGEDIPPPPGANGLLHGADRAGELRWLSQDGSAVLDAQGRPIAAVEPGSLLDAVSTSAADQARTVLGWGLGYVDGPFQGWLVTEAGPDGRQTGFRSDTYVAPVRILDDGSVLGILSTKASPYGGTIGFIDVARGSLKPIHGPLVEAPFGDGQQPVGRNDLMGAVQGPFLRTATGDNCLPVRESTSLDSPELTCAADGTLLYDLNSTTTIGALEWASVRLLGGRKGFALSSYLHSE